MAETDFHWDDLRYFLAVARAGRLTLAAKRLGQDHTTVSRRIRLLETALGCHLFRRSPQGYHLTEAGTRLLQTAETVESVALAAQQQTAGASRGLSGVVRIGAPDGFGSYFLASIFNSFCHENKNLQIELITMPRIFSLSKREADIAIGLTRPTEGRLFARKLTDYHLMLYGSREYLAAQPEIRRPDDLRHHTLIGYVEDYIFTPELDYLRQIGTGLKTALRTALRASNLIAQMRMAVAGAGLCILPHFMARSEPDLSPVLPDDIRLTRTFWMITHADLHDVPRIRACGDFMAESVRQARQNFMPSGMEAP